MTSAVILGFGFRQSATLMSFEDAFAQLDNGATYHAIAVPEDKVAHPYLQLFAEQRGLAVFGVSQAVIAAMETPTQSHLIKQKRQVGSVAEAAALALLKRPADRVRTRCISQDRKAVCAVAEGALL